MDQDRKGSCGPNGPTRELRTGNAYLVVGPTLTVLERLSFFALLVIRCAVFARPGRWSARGGGAESGTVGGRAARDPRQRVALKTYRKFGRIPLRRYVVAAD
ncbi:hypothetical protein ACIA6E_30140 [Streptomyces sp. NPDC051815]|uniref:hypothetical protein n=1 Tax=Streptomyces sp. NPDC051815 TaxID=3365674 RepID=UPI0037B0CE21